MIAQKKLTVAIIGLSLIMVVWIGSLVCGILFQSVFDKIQALVGTVVAMIGTVTSVFITGQAAVDFKTAPPTVTPVVPPPKTS